MATPSGEDISGLHGQTASFLFSSFSSYFVSLTVFVLLIMQGGDLDVGFYVVTTGC